jgi:hypothetical protein
MAAKKAEPHRYDAIRIRAPWIDALEDRCLREIVIQAFESRRVADETKSNPKLIGAGDRALEQIEMGRIHGQKAWRAATNALRKFDEAWMGISLGTTRQYLDVWMSGRLHALLTREPPRPGRAGREHGPNPGQ